MKFNRIITIKDNDNIEVKINQIPLCLENSIFLLHFYEDNKDTRRRFTRNKLIQVDTHILTFRFCETVQFMEELNLFDLSNKQNKYFEIKEHQSIRNLQLIYESNKKIFISKSKARLEW
jgi:hypothetical protein